MSLPPRTPALSALPPCQIESLRNAVRSRAAASKVGAIEPVSAATPASGALCGSGAGALAVVGGVAPKTLFSQRMFPSAAAAEVQGALSVVVVVAAAVIAVVGSRR